MTGIDRSEPSSHDQSLHGGARFASPRLRHDAQAVRQRIGECQLVQAKLAENVNGIERLRTYCYRHNGGGE